MKAPFFIVLVQAFQVAGFITAGPAPIGGEIDQDDLAKMLVEGNVLTALVFSGKVRRDFIYNSAE